MVHHLVTIRAAADSSIISGADPTIVSPSDPLRLFIIQASIIITFTRILGFFLAKLRQPSVIAEVIGGILLGPTVFGRIPGFTQHIFPDQSIPYLNLVANLGLVLFLFLVGLEVDLRIVRRCAVSSTFISLSGLVIPFGLGAAVSVGIYNSFIEKENVSFGHFLLFTGVAMAITALPVLARIVLDLKLIQTRVGTVVLAAGVGNDVVGWILLALAIALVNASSGLNALYIFLVALAWTLALFFIIKPLFTWLARRTGSLMNGPSHTMMTLTVLLVFASAFLTDCIGVHAIFGAFLVGLIIPHEGGFAVALTEKLEDLVSVLFLPLYFTLSGLRTNLATLDSGLAWGYVIAICIVAFFSKFLSCAGAARLCGFANREAAAIGTLMSCKGLVELIVLNLGLNAGILNRQVFSMFVVMALVSTCATTPLTMLVYPARLRTKVREGSLRSKKEDDEARMDPARDPQRKDLDTQRYLFVLDRFDQLPGLLGFVQLLKPSISAFDSDTSSSQLRKRQLSRSSDKRASRSSSSPDQSTSEVEKLPELSHLQQQSHSRSPTSIDALRLVEWTERTSAVMRVAESEETLRSDPLINVFRTFVRLNKLPIQVSMNVVPVDEFSKTVVDRATEENVDFVVFPWNLPSAGLSDPSISQSLFGRPMDSFFGNSVDRADATRHYQAAFARKVVQGSPCHVGLLLEPVLSEKEQQRSFSGQHILFAFMGGPDDRCALDLTVRLCKLNGNVFLSIYRYRKTDDADVQSPPATFHHADTMRRNQATSALYGAHAMQVQDTMYPNAYLNPLQAQLQDDMAIDSAERESHRDADLGRRLNFREISTPTPLAHFIDVIHQQSTQPSTDYPPASMVVLGRNRRMPTITHREELRKLIARHAHTTRNSAEGTHASTETSGASALETRLINGEMAKIVGEAGVAVCGLGQCSLPTLVVASSLQHHVDGEHET